MTNIPCLFLDQYFDSITQCKRFCRERGIPFYRYGIINFGDVDTHEAKDYLVILTGKGWPNEKVIKNFNALYNISNVLFVDHIDRNELPDSYKIVNTWELENILDAYIGMIKGEKWSFKTRKWNTPISIGCCRQWWREN